MENLAIAVIVDLEVEKEVVSVVGVHTVVEVIVVNMDIVDIIVGIKIGLIDVIMDIGGIHNLDIYVISVLAIVIVRGHNIVLNLVLGHNVQAVAIINKRTEVNLIS